MKKVSLFLGVVFSIMVKVAAQLPTDNLIFYYSFNGDVLDKSCNAYDGAVSGATFATDRFGIENNACLFDGVDDYIEIQGKIDTSVVKQPATISFWVKAEEDSAQAIFSINDATSGVSIGSIVIGNYATGSLNNEIITVMRNENDSDKYIVGKTTQDRNDIFDNEWHHIVVVYNDTLTKIYQDSSLIVATKGWGVDNGKFGTSRDNIIYLGARMSDNTLGRFFKGSLDDVRLYNTALNNSEIKNLFQEGYCHHIIYDTVVYYDTVVHYDTVTIYDSIQVTDTLLIDYKLTDIEPASITKIKVYPNPAKDFLIIDLGEENTLENYTIKIIGTDSKLIYESQTQDQISQVDIRSLGNTGLFFIQILDQSGSILNTSKILLE